MINLRKIIALSLCTSMLINSSTSVVSAAIGNIRSFSIASNTNNNDKSEQNKNSIIWISKDSIEVGTEFNTMNGVKAYDEDGSDITNSISVLGQVDNSKPGEYELEYCVKNKSGETIKRTRKVTVKENKTKAELSQETTNKDNEVLNNQENVQEVKIVGPTFTRTYLGEAFNDKANIQAIDSNGKDITSLITVEGQVDVNKVGSYELKYSVADETGKTATLTRKVNVINKNIFNKYIEKINEETKEKIKELGFSIYLDNNTSKFLVENQSKDQLDPSKKDEVVFKIRVIDKDNKEKLKIELLGSDTGESEKLNSLKELEYSFGDYIEINTEEAKERFTIEGEMSGDIKAKLEEGATATEQDKIEDYSDGVDNIDYLLNVRFKITEEGIETVYNKAPEVRGLQPMEKLLTERSSQLEGISVIDDHDGNISNDNIEIYEEKNDEGKTIGLRYEVSDSWGRRVSVLRYLKSQIESSEEAQDIKYIDSEGNINLASENSRTGTNNATAGTLSSNVITVKGFTYSDNSEVRFKLKFNADTNKIEIYDRDSRLFDNKIADKYFQIKLYSKTGTLKRELTINGSDRADNKKIDEFNNTNFEFGDQIEIYHAYSDSKLLIGGNIQNFDGTPNTGIPKNKLESARFELTTEGMKYLVNKPPVIEWPKERNLQITRGDNNVDLLADIIVTDDIDGTLRKSIVNVTPYNPNRLGDQIITYTVKDSWGAIGTYERTVTVVSNSKLANTNINFKNADGTQSVFSIGFDDGEKKLLVQNQSENIQLDEKNPNQIALSIKILSKVGITKKEFNLKGSATGSSNLIQEINNYRYNVDDYIELWSPNYQKSISISGEILKDDDIKADYSNGINNVDFIKNVRFKIESNVLNAEYNNKPKIVFYEDLTKKRGDEFNPLDFIKEITDDHDVLDKNLVKVSYNPHEFDTIGEHKVTYKITDSWGRTTEEIISINVVKKNELEGNKISLIRQGDIDSATDSEIFVMSFNDIDKVLEVDIKGNEFISGSLNGIAFEMSIFDSDKRTPKAISTIRYNEQIDKQALSNILRTNIEYGNMINIKAYSHDKIKISGNIINKSRDFINGFKDEDQMINTRFIVTENGLKEIYNAAPVFEGVEGKSIMKNSDFNKLENVRVTDDHDITIDNENIEITGDVDTSIVGNQTLIYKVTDSWGRSTEVTRQIFVRPLAENNKIILKNSTGNDAFKIGFDFRKMRFTITKLQEGNTPLNSINLQKEFSLSVYNSSGKFIGSFELNGSDTLDDTTFDKLKEIPLSVGSQISLWTKTSTNLRVEGEIIKPSYITENYNEGIINSEYMNNVRFVGTENGIEVIHNRAPEINLPADTNTFVIYKGDDYAEELLKDVSVIDDIDKKIDNNNIIIKFKKVGAESGNNGNNSEDGSSNDGSNLGGSEQGETNSVSEGTNLDEEESGENSDLEDSNQGNESDGPSEEEGSQSPDNNFGGPSNGSNSSNSNENTSEEFITLEQLKESGKLGKYKAYYTVRDSWGRETQVIRDILLESSIVRNGIIFQGNYPNSQHRVGDAFTLKFNINTKKFEITEKNTNIIFRYNNGNNVYHRIYIYNNNGTLKPNGIIELRGSETADSPSAQKLNEISFEYGDYIKLEPEHAIRIKITGPVRDQLEDYSDGGNYEDDFKKTRFYITEEGLRSQLEPKEINNNESIIEFTGTLGGKPFKMVFNHETNQITYPNTTTQYYNYDINNQTALKVYVKKSNEERERAVVNIQGRTVGVPEALKNIFSNNRFNDGDYIRFEYTNIPSGGGISVSGKLKPNSEYADKIISNDNINNIRFYLRSSNDTKYLEPVYNNAPVFKTILGEDKVDGIRDIDIYENQVDSFQPKGDIVVKDDNDTSKDEKDYEVTGPTKNGEITELRGIGKYVYTYTATDSWGRRSTVTRNVYVRPNLFKNKIVLYPKVNTSDDEDNNKDAPSGGVEEDRDNNDSSESIENTDLNDKVSTLEHEEGLEAAIESDGENHPSRDDVIGDEVSTELKPAFEIGFDNDTNRYIVRNRSDRAINEQIGDNPAFKLVIYNSARQEKRTIILNGIDTGESDKLDVLNEVEFQYGDTLTIWTADSQTLRITGDIVKDIQGAEDSKVQEFKNLNYAEVIKDEDYINNVAFQTLESGLKAFYNRAPSFEINNLIENKQLNLYFGEELSSLRDINIADDRDELTLENIVITGENEIDNNRIGSYNVVYTLTDTWGRSTSKEITVNIISKVKKNEIQVYGVNSEEQDEHKFTLKFDVFNNKIQVFRENNIQEDGENSTILEIPDGSEIQNELREENAEEMINDSDDEEGSDELPKPPKNKYFQIIVSNRKGEEKANIILEKDQMNSNEYLEELTKINIFNDDIISLYSVKESNIRITGDIQNIGNYNFSNGFENVQQFSEVKFKVTNNGLELMEHKELKIEFTKELYVNRGDESALLEGVVLKYKNNESIEDLSNAQIEVEDIDVYDVGVYNAKYVITDIWGKTITANRTIRVIERNDLEHNRIVLINSKNNEELMEFYIDTINDKIIVRRFDNEYTGDEGTLITLNLYDESSRKKGSIEVTSENINSIKDESIVYNYGDLISISAYDIKNGLSIKGNIEGKRENYLYGVNNKDNIENVRFKIEEKGLKSIYNNAPVINIDSSLVTYKDETVNLYEGITVSDSDSHDSKISKSDVVIDTELDITRIGTYSATYILQDTWGRETRKTRDIVVKSSLLNNKIQFYEKDNNSNDKSDISNTPSRPDTPNGSGNETTGDEEKTDEIVEVNTKEATSEGEDTNPNPDSDRDEEREEEDIPGGGESSDNEDDKEEVKVNSLFDISINLQERKFVVTKNNEDLKRVRKELSELLTRTSSNEEITIPDDGNIGDQPSEETPSQPDNGDGDDQQGGDNASDDDTDSSPGEDDSSDAVAKPGVGIVKPNTPIDGVEFEFKLFDENGKVKKELSIKTVDLVNRSVINSKLNKFNNTEFKFGDYISVYSRDSKNGIKITGNIDNPNRINEDYSDGIDDTDYMYNVRFKINEDAMDVVYNEAPKITILNPTEVIDVYCGDNIDYGDGAEISDDHDLDIGSNNITISEEDKKKIATLGKQTINLILTDSWGRSVSVQRTYNVKTSIDRNIISFPGHDKSYGDYDVFKLKFDSTTNQIKVFDKQDKQIHVHGDRLFFRITVYNGENNTIKRSIELKARDHGTNPELDKLNGLSFEYGDYINIYAYQTKRVKISGPVRNPLEDYSDGVDLADDLASTYFYITEDGLKSEFKPETLQEHESLIEFIATNGGTPFKIKFNHSDKTVSFPETTEFYNYTEGKKHDVFRVKYYDASANGGSGALSIYNSQNNDNSVNGELKTKLTNERFDTGDYIAFEYLDIPDSYYGLRLTGKVVIGKEADEDLKNEDYSDGIQNKRNLTEVRFYLNKDGQPGIFPVRVPAATITGAEDIDVLQNTRFNLKDHVKATDSDGEVLTGRMTVTGDNTLARSVNDNWDLDTSRIGLYYAKYEVVNKEGIKTTVYRNIRVYTNATLALKDSDEEIVMEQGAYPTVESKKEFLKKFAMAQDPEAISDNAEQINQKLTDSIDVDVSQINIEKPGTYPIKYSVVNAYGKKSELEANVSVVRTINVSVPTTLPFQVVTNLLNTDDTTNTQDPFVSGVLKLKNNRTSDVRVSIESFNKEDNSGNLDIVNPNTVENWDTLSKEESMSKMSLGIFVKSGFKDETNTPGAGGDSNPGSGSESNPGAGDTDSGNGSTPGTSEPSTPSPDGSTSGGASSEGGASGGTGGETEGDLGSSEDTNQDSTSRTANDVLNERNVTWLVPNETTKTFMGTLPRASSLQTPSEGKLSFTSKHGKNFIGGTYKGKFKLVFKFE